MSDVAGSHELTVAAPLGRCLELLLDVERYPAWYDTLDSVRIVAADEAGRASLVDVAIDAGPLGTVTFGLRLSYDLETEGVATIAGRQAGASSRVEGVANCWRLEAANVGETHVRYDFEVSARGRSTRLLLRGARALVEHDLVRGFPLALAKTVR